MQRPSTSFYYSGHGPARLTVPALEGAAEADVCVIGAGYTGVSTATEPGRAALRWVVLERRLICWGLPGRTAGRCAPAMRRAYERSPGWVRVEDASACGTWPRRPGHQRSIGWRATAFTLHSARLSARRRPSRRTWANWKLAGSAPRASLLTLASLVSCDEISDGGDAHLSSRRCNTPAAGTCSTQPTTLCSRVRPLRRVAKILRGSRSSASIFGSILRRIRRPILQPRPSRAWCGNAYIGESGAGYSPQDHTFLFGT